VPAVPRSSQCPSIVTVPTGTLHQLGVRVERRLSVAGDLELSSAKNTGFSGDSRWIVQRP
jgi:hypothetical protein